MVVDIWTSALLGALGGVGRSVLGVWKAKVARRKMVWSYWLITVFASAIIGAITGTIFSFDLRLSVLAGYAGTDILEGVYKAVKIKDWLSMAK